MDTCIEIVPRAVQSAPSKVNADLKGLCPLGLRIQWLIAVESVTAIDCTPKIVSVESTGFTHSLIHILLLTFVATTECVKTQLLTTSCKTC